MGQRSFTLKELSRLTGAELFGNEEHLISGVNTLEEATSEDASFLTNPRYAEAMKSSNAGIICIGKNVEKVAGKNYLVCLDPARAIQTIAELFVSPEPSGFTGIHPTAVIHPTAQIHPSATIGPNAVIDRHTKIGAHTFIGPNVSIGYLVTIGDNCQIHPNCVVRERCQLGNRVILQPGAVIGSCGFGYTTDAQGNHTKLEQLGIVVLEDDTEIGANTTIDRARFKATIIGKGTKIDNLVQIAHNVEIGSHNVIAAQTGIAGSTKTGKYVMMGGQTGILGHVEIDDHVMLATRTGGSKSLKKGQYRGTPAQPINDYHRQEAHVRKLEKYVERLKTLENLLASERVSIK
jgi:UDP-3-O-[3-hydroxymyristoyl] glucosamine N-acyltransferase